MVFIDTPNITSSARHFDITRLKFDELVKVVVSEANRVGATAYVLDRPEIHNFCSILEKLGIHVERVSPGKSVDGRLIFDVLNGIMEDSYDIAILCSGDRDYIRVAEVLKRKNKKVWVASFSHSISIGLKSNADKFINLDDYIAEITLSTSKGIGARDVLRKNRNAGSWER